MSPPSYVCDYLHAKKFATSSRKNDYDVPIEATKESTLKYGVTIGTSSSISTSLPAVSNAWVNKSRYYYI